MQLTDMATEVTMSHRYPVHLMPRRLPRAGRCHNSPLVQDHLRHWSSPTSGKLIPQQNQVDNQLSALAIRNQFSNLDFPKQHGARCIDLVLLLFQRLRTILILRFLISMAN